MSERKSYPSASGYEALMLCRGRHALESTIAPKDDSSDDSRSGDRIHAFMADGSLRCPSCGYSKEDAGLHGDHHLCGGVIPELSDDEERVAEKFKREESDLVATLVGEPLVALREERLWLTRAEDTFSGQPDAVFVGEEAILIEDYKSGWLGATSAPRNPQLRALAVLVAGRFRQNGRPIHVAVLLRSGKPSVATYTEEDIETAREELMGVLRTAADPTAPRTPGDKQCKYCRAANALVCPDAMAAATSLVTMHTRELATDELLRALDICGPAKKVIASIEAAAKYRLSQDPASVPGWELSPGDIKTKVTDVAGVYAKCAEAGVTNEKFTAACSITKTNLKAVLKEATAKRGRELDALVKETTEGFVETSQNAPSLQRVNAA